MCEKWEWIKPITSPRTVVIWKICMPHVGYMAHSAYFIIYINAITTRQVNLPDVYVYIAMYYHVSDGASLGILSMWRTSATVLFYRFAFNVRDYYIQLSDIEGFKETPSLCCFVMFTDLLYYVNSYVVHVMHVLYKEMGDRGNIISLWMLC